MLVLDRRTNSNANDPDRQLQVVGNRDAGSSSTGDTTTGDDVFYDGEAGVLETVIRGVDGELEGGV